MTKRYKQQLQLPSLEEYKSSLSKEFTNQLAKIQNIDAFTEERQEEYQAPTSNWSEIVKGKHSKTKNRTVKEISKEKYDAQVQNIRDSFSKVINEIFEQIKAKQEEIRKEYDILSKIPVLENLASAESSLGAAIMEVEKLKHLTSREGMNILPPKQSIESIETISVALQEVKTNFFDTEHYIKQDQLICENAQMPLTGSDATPYEVVDSPLGKGILVGL